jgi:hypothetical protein
MKVEFIKRHYQVCIHRRSDVTELEESKALSLEKEGFVKVLKTEKAIKKTTKTVETATKKIK